MNPIRKSALLLFSLTIAVVLSGCVKQDFEEPEAWNFPVGTVLTVEQLRNMFTGDPVTFTEDYSVFATVTMDDKSGNIYRSAYVQDATGAINLRTVAPGGIYQGDSVRIYLRGTTLSSYQRMLQLDNVNIDRNIIKLGVGKQLTPRTVTISELNAGGLQSWLVRLDNVQFHRADTAQPFADKENLITMNRVLEDCNGQKINVRTSGYAGFADQPVPGGNGSLVAVVAQYLNEMQLYIRSVSELDMEGERCAVPGDDYTLWSLANLRQNYYEGVTQIPPNVRIEGVVISDAANENLPRQNLYLMDESGAGMAIRFAANQNHGFELGSRIRIIVSNMSITNFNGLIQIDQVPNGNAYDLGPGQLPEPYEITMAQAIANMPQYQSTLVRFSNTTITGGTTFSGNLNITDQTAQMLLYTYAWASFASQSVPTSPVTITGILSSYNSPQLLIRNLNDIQP